jgi:hypothetical protein
VESGDQNHSQDQKQCTAFCNGNCGCDPVASGVTGDLSAS